MERYRRLKKQPISVVLAEYRFSRVMMISDFIPKIQESLRRKFPTLNTLQDQVVEVSGTKVSTNTSESWLFYSADKKEAVKIDQERFVYLTSSYDRFPTFKKVCLDALNVVLDIVEPTLVTRIGLRYNDLVLCGDYELSDLVDPAFLVGSSVLSLGNGVRFKRTETVLETAEGVLAIRSLLGRHKKSVMPDLENTLPIRAADSGGEQDLRLILDFDHYWLGEDGEKLNIDFAEAKLESLHELSREAFWSLTTEYAREELWD